MTKGKTIIISAPSGTGKSTIINAIIGDPALDLRFSVSATSRAPRAGEEHGKHYYFLTQEEFESAVKSNSFIEWEEVYAGCRYGTLRSEIDRITSEGHNVIMDVDVKGGINVKRMIGADALSIFIKPPSVESLRQRLEGRATDSAEQIARRVAKASEELGYACEFDHVVVNDVLDDAVHQVHDIINSFVARESEA